MTWRKCDPVDPTRFQRWLQPNRNLLTGGEHITYIPLVAIIFLLGQGPVEITGHAKQ